MQQRRGTTAIAAIAAVAMALLGVVNPAQASSGCQIFLAAGSWLQGRGVEVNKEGTCAFGAYQCTDLAERQYDATGWLEGKNFVQVAPTYGAESMIYQDGSGWHVRTSAPVPTLSAFPGNGSYTPVPGDLVIMGTNWVPAAGGAGHVAVVETVSASSFTVVEQNPAGRGATYTKGGSGWVRAGYVAKGFIHSTRNALGGGGGGGGGAAGDGAFVQFGGDIYRIAGGAPVWVSSWDPYGGAQPVQVLNQTQWNSLRTFPVDGTFLVGLERGEIYRIAGGAPIWVSPAQWNAMSPTPAAVGIPIYAIDHAGEAGAAATQLSHLRYFPADGTYVVSPQSPAGRGEVYTIVGGAPVYVTSTWWESLNPHPALTAIAQESLDAAGSGGIFSHLRAHPADGTFVVTPSAPAGRGEIYRFAGGAPVYVTSSWWDTISPKPQVYGVAQEALDLAGQPGAWSHVRSVPLDGTFVAGPGAPAGRGETYVIAGGAPIYVTWEYWQTLSPAPAVTTVSQESLDRGLSGAPWEHIRFLPLDGTYLVAGGSTYRTLDGVPVRQGTSHVGVAVDPEAVSRAGEGLPWAHLAAPLPTVTSPGAPSGVTASAGNASVSVSWSAPVSNGGAPITGYVVTASPGGKTCATSGGLSCTVAGLSNGTGYSFTVRASNPAGMGPASAPSAVVVPSAGSTPPPPPPPTGAVPSAPGLSVERGKLAAVLSWSPPADPGSSAVDAFRVEYSVDGGGSWTDLGAALDGDVRSQGVQGLTVGVSYWFRVTAHNAAGWGTASNVVSLVGATTPGRVRSPSARFPRARVAVLRWLAPASSGGVRLGGYRLRVSANGGGSWGRWMTTSATSLTRKGWVKGRVYRVQIRAFNTLGAGPVIGFKVRPTR